MELSLRRERHRQPVATSTWKRPYDEGPAGPSPTYAGELRARDAVAVSDSLAARDLGSVRDQRLELLVADPGRDDVRRLLALLGCLEEAKRAEDAVTGISSLRPNTFTSGRIVWSDHRRRSSSRSGTKAL